MSGGDAPGFVYYSPVRLVFGWGRLEELGTETTKLGRRALVVTTGALFEQTGLAARARRLLAGAGVEAYGFAAVSPNPTTEEIDAGAAEAAARGADVVIGLGGGSAIDAAKGIAVAAGHGRPIWSYADPASRAGLGDRMLPVVAVPTTAGTGSEVTQYIVVTHRASGRKPGIASSRTYPATAIVDPELTVGLPPAVTAASGFDAITHAIESYINRNAGPITDLYCREALRLAGGSLRAAFRDAGDREARTAMALAATLAGAAIAACRTTACHALAHAAGGMHNLTHGEALAALTPPTLRHLAAAGADRCADVAALLAGAAGARDKRAADRG
jgi:alcohol dehydrogenase class IV